MSDDGRYVGLMSPTKFRLFEIDPEQSAPTKIVEQWFVPPLELQNRSTFDYPRFAFSQDGQWVAASFPDEDWVQHTIRVWDMASGKLVAEVEGDFYVVTALVFRPVSTILAIGHRYGIDYWKGEITYFDVMQQRKLYTERPSGAITELAYDADGTKIMIATGNGTGSDMTVYFAESGEYVGSVLGCPCSLSPTWRHMVAHENPDGDHPVLVTLGGDTQRLISVQNPPRGRDQFAWSYDGNYVAIVGGDGKVMVVDVRTGLQWAIGIGAMEDHVGDLLFHPQQNVLAFQNRDHQIVLWDLEANLEIQRIIGSDAAFIDMQFSPDGGRLVIARRDAVRIWDVDAGTIVYLYKEWVNRVSFSPDGRFVLTTGRRVQMWRLPEALIS
jgi:WD40 repeat protein